MKKFKKMFGVIMLLCTMMTANAFAEEPSTYTVGADDADSFIPITKYLNINGVVPSATFEFVLEPVTVTGQEQENDGITLYSGKLPDNMQNLTAKATFGSDSDETEGVENQRYKTTGISLEGVTFDVPGAYRYKLTEVKDTAGILGITYDTTEYFVDVYVGYAKENGVEAQNMSILQINVLKEKETTDGTKLEKVGSTINGTGTVPFTNSLSPDSAPLTITKTVAGNMGDRSKAFEFTLNINTTDDLPETLQATLYNQKNETSSVPIKIGADAGDGATFSLKHGERLVIPNLPEGTTYTVTEKTEGYTATIASSSNIADRKVSGVDDAEATEASVENMMTAGGNTEAFTNTLDKKVDTGITLDILPYILIFVLAIGGAALLLAKKRKNAR